MTAADLIRRIEAYQRGESQEITRILIDCIAALQAPAEGDAGLTDEQANALAAFYDVSPGTVHDIYALSKPKAASDAQPRGRRLAWFWLRARHSTTAA